MNKKNTKILLEQYPKIFIRHTWLISKSSMGWLFECDNGWFWLIYNLCMTIQNYIKYNNIPQIEATQVKEKYGGLRFYYQGGDDLIDGMVWLAEDLSYKICEGCGSTVGVKQTKGWIVTLCPKCMKKYKKKFKITLIGKIK